MPTEIKEGDEVLVTRDDYSTFRSVAISDPFKAGGHWVIWLRGVREYYLLDRVKKLEGWEDGRAETVGD